MNQIKICHVASGFLRDDARIFYRQCKSLVDERYDVSMLVNDYLEETNINNVNIYTHGFLSKGRLFDILFAKYFFLKKAKLINADIYQLHGPELIGLGLALKKMGKIVFYDAHEDLPRDILDKESIPFFLRPVISYITELYLKHTLVKFDHVFTVTPHIVNNLKKITNQITLITNFPHTNTYNNFTLNDYLNRQNIICYSGTVYKYSNQENMIKAVLSNKNIYYTIVGFIDDDFKINLQKLSNNNQRVNFIPKVNKAELSQFLNTVVIGFVVYDYVRNLGYKIGSLGTNKLFEYMIAGLPVICTDFDLWKNIIDKHKCGLYVEPNNENDLNNAINFLINNKEIAFKMGQNGRNAILTEYNWNNEEIKYISVFSKYKNEIKLLN
jgi:glycosyltransferase involved in cell wall biosynthesis